MSAKAGRPKVRSLRLTQPTHDDVERLAMALAWQENTEREFIRNRARAILGYLATVTP